MNQVRRSWAKIWEVAKSEFSKTAQNLAQAKHISPGRDMQNLSHPLFLIYSLKRVVARLGENALHQGWFERQSLAWARLFYFFLSRSSRLSENGSLKREFAFKWGTGAEFTHFSLQTLAPNSRSSSSFTVLSAPFTHSILWILTHKFRLPVLISLQGKFYFSFSSFSPSIVTVLYAPNPRRVPMFCLLHFVLYCEC